MTRTRQIILALLLTLNVKNITAATVTAVTAGVTAAQLGVDPWPWIIGSAGAAIAYLMRVPSDPRVAIANGGISILFGGLGAPFLANVIESKLDPAYANDLVFAAILSIGWPWLVPLAMGWVTRFVNVQPKRDE